MGINFGTGGWRAIIGDGFTKVNIQLLAKALCDKMKAEGVAGKGIVIGYDRRFLAKEAMQWAAMVFAAEGILTELVNKSAPTPLLMFYVMQHNLPYGMMVTASHNPAVYNGIKIFTAGGRDADEVQTADIERFIAAVEPGDVREMEYEAAVEAGLIKEIYPLNEYIDNIISAIRMVKIREANLKVAFDPMYGVSKTSLNTILHTARCEVVAIHERHDTLFGGKLPSPSAATLRSLQNAVIDGKCDIGLATDGDADRIGVIDDNGRFLHPNDILVLLYYYLVKYRNMEGAVVRNIATTHQLDRVAESFGQVCHEVPVGFKHISAKIAEADAVLGGESSGGLTIRGHIKGKDGIYAAMLLVEMIAVTGQKISRIYADIEAEYGSIHMEERDYKFTQGKRAEIYTTLMEKRELPVMTEPVERVSYLDGSKVYFQNGGWVLARFSGTEPLLRIFCEMPCAQDAVEVCNLYEGFLDLASS
ncbi:MAG: phosphoglucomutase/phosphomannomutase family protein [Lachnospiraceae bacterium]|jgi:phosphomannomutase|nr:phosphoglucomutase/phosphomannomutase family protein [Lachnospiraceae bacterium]